MGGNTNYHRLLQRIALPIMCISCGEIVTMGDLLQISTETLHVWWLCKLRIVP